ncbi:hypothetical protein LCGC14_1803960 [marine sediment metagenome]|uniref:Uncharacterized protein n=1 Tax=marine sediment metagenome TaxID=412755 RepID=A0A0F9J3I0_9ZZZZ
MRRNDLPRCPVCGRFPVHSIRAYYNGWTGELHQDILVCCHGMSKKPGMNHSDLYVYATARRAPCRSNITKQAKQHSLKTAEWRWRKLCEPKKG